jgi:catechol 2,3-dioxygenase-like lactoylglutathione lyase family enzyme
VRATVAYALVSAKAGSGQSSAGKRREGTGAPSMINGLVSCTMQPYLSFITLGVSDLERSKRFYSDILGWRPVQDNGGIVMYKLNGMILSLYPQKELMEDAGTQNDSRGSRFTLAQCLRSSEDVDALFAELKKHGATIAKEPVKAFWGGYSGYFADPDGHLWEIAHNPFLELDAEGNVLGMQQG